MGRFISMTAMIIIHGHVLVKMVWFLSQMKEKKGILQINQSLALMAYLYTRYSTISF